jgi:cell division septal protein FtsQ
MVKKNFLRKTGKIKYSQKKRINFFKILYWFFFAAFSGVITYTFLFSGFLNVLSVEFSPTEKIDSQRLASRLDLLLSEKYLNLVPKNNILLLKEGWLNDLFTQEFGIVKKIKIIKKFPDKIKITVEERSPILVLENSQGKFILDEEGNTYADNFFNSSGFNQADLPILKEENSELAFSFNNNSGLDYLNFIFGVKDKLENLLDIHLKKEIISSRIISGDVFFEAEDGWRMYFNKEVEINKGIEMLRLVLDEKIGSEKIKDLEYIDLRINNKVYYKFKDIQEEKDSSRNEDVSAKKSEDENKKKD